MITAREALALPSARLKPTDAADAEKILAHVEAHVRARMQRGGCVVPVDPALMNDAIAAEVQRACARAGWNSTFEPVAEHSALAGGKPIITGFKLVLQPKPEAYDAADGDAPLLEIERVNPPNGVAR